MQKVFDYIEAHAERGLQLLERLCRQPSVSAQGWGLEEMARLVAQTMEEYGLAAEIWPTDGGPPLVYAEIGGESPGGAAPYTVLFYNHYDVQPVDPLNEWTTPPFEPSRRNGKLFARGAADNKGDFPARLEAIRALREVNGQLPINIKFIIDGEEESGSPYFPEAIKKYAHRLKADFCISEGNVLNADGTPNLVLGVKGLVYVELSTQGAKVDAHSAYATVVPSPTWRLVHALASLKDTNGRVAIEGFYDRVRELNSQERAAVEAMPDNAETLRQALGLERFIDNLQGYAWRERVYNAPTCNICGLEAGYTGPGLKTVLPSRARAKVDFRLVPNQRPQEVLAQLRAHLDRHGFDDISIHTIAANERPVRTAVDDPWVLAAAAATTAYYGKAPSIVINNAGTAPMDMLVDEVTPSLFFAPGGAGYAGSRIHAPDEHIRIADLVDATKVTALLLQHFGAGTGK